MSAPVVHVHKMHGLGNDFLVVDVRALDEATAARLQEPATVRQLCDRQFGLGGDGVLAVRAPRTDGAVAEMRVLNADGSEAEMCGNGLRCVAKYLYDRAGERGDALIIDTGAGPLSCGLSVVDGAVDAVTVDMGRPRLTRGEIPMTGPAGERCIEAIIALDHDALTPAEQAPVVAGERAPGSYQVTAVSMGNPHAVVFVDGASAARALAETVGPALETHAWFPRKTNAEWCSVAGPDTLDLVVWERGCGITLACGTGACATAVAACLTGRAEVGRELTVRLPGGPLAITVAPEYATVFMRGPARFVFEADVDLDTIAAAARPSA
jgi:diaminopimelate epimerase